MLTFQRDAARLAGAASRRGGGGRRGGAPPGVVRAPCAVVVALVVHPVGPRVAPGLPRRGRGPRGGGGRPRRHGLRGGRRALPGGARAARAAPRPPGPGPVAQEVVGHREGPQLPEQRLPPGAGEAGTRCQDAAGGQDAAGEAPREEPRGPGLTRAALSGRGEDLRAGEGTGGGRARSQ